MIWRNWSTRMLLLELAAIDPDLYEDLDFYYWLAETDLDGTS